MKRLLLVLIAMVVFGSACSTTLQTYAVKVDDMVISEEVVDNEIEAVTSNPRSVETLEAQLGELGGLRPGGDNTLSSRYVSQVVYTRVLGTLFEREVERLGLDVTEEAIETAATQLRGSEDSEAFESFPASYRDYIVERQADLATLVADRTSPEKLQAYFDENQEQFGQSCIRHVLVPTEEAAQDVRQQISDGAEFGDVANELSLDNPAQQGGEPNGGELGCYSSTDLQQLVGPFREAVGELDVNELSDPVQTQFGFHVIEVTSREEPSFADAREQIEGLLGDPNRLFADLLADVEIEVNPRYGTYVPGDPASGTVGQIVPVTPAALQPDPGDQAQGSSPSGMFEAPSAPQ